ncbi:MAG: flavin reductase [Crocinitomicaceae bacterium]|nr:flavin reductase [Crocinitomicaceae bacterium]
MHITRKDLNEMHRVRRLNLINGITGIKPANLIGTRSKTNIPNVSIFSSIVHLGSDPALFGFILRPTGEVPRNTYENILETGYYTLNHIHESFIENAHYTSAKFDANVSEFEKCSLTEEYLYNFPAPFVGESKIKLGLHFVEELSIKSNGTKMIVGEIEQLIIPKNCLDDKGYLRLDQISDVGIGGLNNYYSLRRIKSLPYARVREVPDFGSYKT